MVDIVLHIGLHKTATGTLQRQFFPACRGMCLLTTLVPEMRSFMELVTRKDPLYFDPDGARQVLEPVMRAEQPNVLSNESFSGPPYAGVIEGGLDHRWPILMNLKSVFPDARAMIVLRRQDALSRSLYRQYLKVGGTRGIRRFYGLENGHAPLMTLDRFFYHTYINAVGKAFPKGLLILTFEQFVTNQQVFLRKIAEFIGIEQPDILLTSENSTRLGPFGMEFSRQVNRLFRSSLNPAGILPGIPYRQVDGVRLTSPVFILHDRWPRKGATSRRSKHFRAGQQILDATRKDNEALDAEHHLDLQRYGYY